ncbi:CBS domain-containing protein [Arhodomonas sp. AD133]|uniref:CBS domain-containing protein n=1 Tax=Arhodomonas sp. AD133 TaxID=3415009 RepID=UPI003EB6BF7E
MSVGEYCTRDVIIMRGDESVAAAAKLMREQHIGDVVLVEDRGDVRRPTGIVTDRDLVVEVMATGLQAETLALRDIVTESAYLVREDDSLFDALELMRHQAVRRVPVVDDAGDLVGLIAVDDVIGLLAEMLDDLAAVVERQREREQARRP